MKQESKFKISSRYAEALYEAAAEKGDVAAVMKDMDVLIRDVANDKQAITYLANPLSLRCLEIIAERNRFAELGMILNDFKSLYYARHGIVEVKVETVKPLSKTQDSKLKANLEKLLDKKVLIDYQIKPEILGGLVVSYGSDMIDDSISGKLNRLENVMKGGQ